MSDDSLDWIVGDPDKVQIVIYPDGIRGKSRPITITELVRYLQLWWDHEEITRSN